MNIPTLDYNGRPMRPEPTNMTLEDVAAALARGASAVVDIQPGDATRYSVLVTPAAAPDIAPHLGRFGIAPTKAHLYVLATYLDDEGGRSAWIALDATVLAYDVEPLAKNPWTRELLAWWFNVLRATMCHHEGARHVTVQSYTVST